MAQRQVHLRVFPYEGDTGQHGFRIVDGNGEKIAGGEGYSDESGAIRGLVNLIDALQGKTKADIEIVDPNGNVVRQSGQPRSVKAPSHRRQPASQA